MTNAGPREALEELMRGNGRFAAGKALHPRQDAARRAEVSGGQHPTAAIVACSDSRVPPEIVFDQGIGDLFVVRSAGNVLDAVGHASLEYAVEHLHIPLVLVLGHTRCGAVQAALSSEIPAGHLGSIVEALGPSIESARAAGGDPVLHAARENVRRQVALLRGSEPILASRVSRGTLRIVGALYDIDRGVVEVID